MPKTGVTAATGWSKAWEMQAFQRAAKGNDRMLTFLLKSYKPETYNQRPSDKAGQSQGLNIADLVDKVRQWA